MEDLLKNENEYSGCTDWIRGLIKHAIMYLSMDNYINSCQLENSCLNLAGFPMIFFSTQSIGVGSGSFISELQ